MSINVRGVLVLCLAVAAAGCPAQNQVLLPPPGSIAISRLYVGNASSSPGQVLIFAPPFSGSSTATATVAVPNAGSTSRVFGIAFDSAGRMYVSDERNSAVYTYPPPFLNSSTPSVKTTNASLSVPEGLVIDGAGNLVVADNGNNNIQVYSLPLTATSTPLTTLNSTGVLAPHDLAFDSAGNLYVGNCGNHNVIIYAAPYKTATPAALTITGAHCPEGVAFDSAGRLYVSDALVTPRVYVITPPFSGTANVVTTMTGGTTPFLFPDSLTFDSSGNLYVSDDDNNLVEVFTPPFTATESPTFSISNGVNGPFFVTFGP